MSAKNLNWYTALLLGAALVLTLAGCEMSVNKDEAKGNKNVEINTPFGDLKVKNRADAKDTGLPAHPAATIKPSDRDDKSDKGQASVSMSLFGLKVAVVSYVSDD